MFKLNKEISADGVWFWNFENMSGSYSLEYLNAQFANTGYELRKIEKEEKKMTRQEAIDILFREAKFSDYNANNFVKAIEVLGLIKFEEEKKVDWPYVTIHSYDPSLDEIHDFQLQTVNVIDALTKAGYTVTKNG